MFILLNKALRFSKFNNQTKFFFSTINCNLLHFGFDNTDIHEATICNLILTRDKRISTVYRTTNIKDDSSYRLFREKSKEISKANINKIDVCSYLTFIVPCCSWW